MRQTASPPGLLGGMKGMALEECTRRDATHFRKLVLAYRNTAHYGPLTHLAILHLYISAGGIGRGLLPQTIIDSPPTPQSSIYRLSAGGIGRGLLILNLLDSNACQISLGRRRHPHTHPAIFHFFVFLERYHPMRDELLW